MGWPRGILYLHFLTEIMIFELYPSTRTFQIEIEKVKVT